MAADDAGLLVPVKQSSTLRQTVGYVVQQAVDRLESTDSVSIRFVVVASWREGDPGTDAERADAEALLEQIDTWCRFDLEDVDVDPDAIGIDTAVIGDESYLFSPSDYADVLVRDAEEHGSDRVVLDPEYSIVGQTTLLEPLEFELTQTDLAVEEAPVDRPTQRGRLVGRTNPVRFLTLFGGSFLFYQILGGFSGVFDIVTGIATGLVVAITLTGVSFYQNPTLSRSPRRLLRGVVYVPYLLYEILVANVVVARVILDPRKSIQPCLTRIRVYVGSGLPLTTLANSITLTPGTLTVTADDQDLYVHSLVPFAREGLFDGALERWVRFVFYGREAARFPTPRERGDIEELQDPTPDRTVTDGGESPTERGEEA